ncbi:hypothetical protein [Halorubrum trueperi]|uniref:Uncharacterized protein n=1 Tax=Halorubrum trueperi TaxID=2004704 RepID=A0ABD5UJD8_9EURY
MFSTRLPSIPVRADAEIVDGRTTMAASGDASLYVAAPEQRPLGSGETHLQLKVAGDGTETVVELDADALQQLVDAIEEARESHEPVSETFDPADYDDVQEALEAAPDGYDIEGIIDHFDPVLGESEENEEVPADV